MKVLIKNIKQLVQFHETTPGLVKGTRMKELPVLENAWVAIEDGRFVDFGKMEDWPGISDWRDLEIIDADGKIMLPLWVDSHTHVVFADTREREFVDRINGLSYEEIANRGGGILNSAKALRKMSEDELFDKSLLLSRRLIATGTGALEIKSGYGLDLESELKMLRVATRLKSSLPIPVKRTFLGAHAVPTNFKGNKQGYMDQVVNEMLPAAVKEHLVDYVDIFTEK
ncbi:MAG: imidazolonepropionase, partial [Bacteroidota bacterium]